MTSSIVEQFAYFDGDRAASAPLTWGQRAIWKAIESVAPNDHWLNVRRVIPCGQRRAIGVAAATTAVGRLVAAHETLRTRVRVIDGDPYQMVVRSGRLPVEIVEAEAGPPGQPPRQLTELHAEVLFAEPAVADATEALLRRMAERPFHYEQELPVRVGMVVVAGVVRYIVLVLSHVAADFHAAEMLVRDLRLALLRGEPPTPTGLRPVDLARREENSDRRTGRALEHWLDAYRRLPAEQLAVRAPARTPRFHEALLTSRALIPAADLLAERHRVSSSTVLLTATAVVLAAHTGHDCCGLLTIVNNRHQPGHVDILAPMNQLGLFVLDLAACAGLPPGTGEASADPARLAAILPHAWQAALAGYRHAYYDQAGVDRALAASGRGGDLEVDPYSCFNDVRTVGVRDASEPLADPDTLAAAVVATTLHWRHKDAFNWRFYLEVRDAPGAAVLALCADTRYLPPTEIERFVRDLERYVVAAALHEINEKVSLP